ncbi:MAG: hypothetical protein RL616_787, partial [Verrucomicrobiota bacterium]
AVPVVQVTHESFHLGGAANVVRTASQPKPPAAIII